MKFAIRIAVHTLALVFLGQSEPARTLGEDTMQRGRRALGPDDTTTLTAAAALTQALNQLGEAGLARALGQDTLERCRRVLGTDNPLTQYVTQAACSGPRPADNAAADQGSRPPSSGRTTTRRLSRARDDERTRP